MEFIDTNSMPVSAHVGLTYFLEDVPIAREAYPKRIALQGRQE
jgi:hypothetical protein